MNHKGVSMNSLNSWGIFKETISYFLSWGTLPEKPQTIHTIHKRYGNGEYQKHRGANNGAPPEMRRERPNKAGEPDIGW